jgi:hypothetical protein
MNIKDSQTVFKEFPNTKPSAMMVVPNGMISLMMVNNHMYRSTYDCRSTSKMETVTKIAKIQKRTPRVLLTIPPMFSLS